jgi:hypothetical protein
VAVTALNYLRSFLIFETAIDDASIGPYVCTPLANGKSETSLRFQ